jgi:threonine dehydratase
MTLNITDIYQAAQRIRPYAHRTPVLTCESLNRQIDAQVFMKCENLQKVGAFKFRGACNAIFALPADQVAQGVIAHSSGNHAQALALAARLRGIPAYLIMPDNAPAVKKAAVAGYGGLITYCEPIPASRETTQARVMAETGAIEVHPYDNEWVIAGQGTAALELLQEMPDLDVIMTPVGGGGLLSGTAIAARELSLRIRIIAAEPEGADDAFRSLDTGSIVPSTNPQTIADGLLSSLGNLTFPIIQKQVEQIVTVSEEGIISAMKFVWERAKIIIEPSAAVPLAALWERKIDLTGLRIGVIISGGNVDLEKLPW